MENLTDYFCQVTLANTAEQVEACRERARALCTPDTWGHMWGVYTPMQVVEYAHHLAHEFGRM